MKTFLLILTFSLLSVSSLLAQDELFDLLEENAPDESGIVEATFKATRIVTGHSIENLGEGTLDVRIHHRFGALNSGAYELFGLDDAQTRLALEYGISDRLMIGVGRSSFQKTYDSFIKYRLFDQTTGGEKSFPVAIGLLGGVTVVSENFKATDSIQTFEARLSYTTQVLIAKKINEKLSVQLTPTYIHRNVVPYETDPNDVVSLGFGTRYKVSKRTSFNLEYYPTYPWNMTYQGRETFQSLSMGVDIETGGHVFQLHVTNSRGMTEKSYIPETTGNWLDGDIHFGFNVSRVFSVK